jgi:hypothetical protein
MKMTCLLRPAAAALLSLALCTPALADRTRPTVPAQPAKAKAAAPAKALSVQRTKPGSAVAPVGGMPQLKAPAAQLHDWYCGEGAGPGGHAVCTQELINSCSGKYHPPGTFGEHQTWGTCHEPS